MKLLVRWYYGPALALKSLLTFFCRSWGAVVRLCGRRIKPVQKLAVLPVVEFKHDTPDSVSTGDHYKRPSETKVALR